MLSPAKPAHLLAPKALSFDPLALVSCIMLYILLCWLISSSILDLAAAGYVGGSIVLSPGVVSFHVDCLLYSLLLL